MTSIQDQLKHPPVTFAACPHGTDCKADTCLRGMVWRECELKTLTVLNPNSPCLFHELTTLERVRGIPKLDIDLSHRDYRSFRSQVLNRLPRVMLYRIEKSQTWASKEYQQHVETVWRKFSDKPFPWLEREQVVDWQSARLTP